MSLLLLLMTTLQPATRPTTAPVDAGPPLRFMSFNLRNSHADDGEHDWRHRRPMVRQTLRFYRPDVLGCQEAYKDQVDALAEDLPDYRWVGVGREDGKQKGEYAPIFYDARRLELVDGGTFWLSPTPERVASVGWDAMLTRIATRARFKDKRDGGREFLAVNTHFDHVGETARGESAKLIVKKAAEIAAGLPLVVTGDFNSAPETAAYQTMTKLLTDARATAKTVLGPAGTFGTFTTQVEPPNRIDYIFVTPGTPVARFATLSQEWDGGVHASDHFPILADVTLPR